MEEADVEIKQQCGKTGARMCVGFYGCSEKGPSCPT